MYICSTTINYSIGVVEYNVDGFVERNKDVFNNDLIELMQTSTNNLIQKLFPDVIDRDNRKRPPTAGSKIKKQVIELNTKYAAYIFSFSFMTCFFIFDPAVGGLFLLSLSTTSGNSF